MTSAAPARVPPRSRWRNATSALATAAVGALLLAGAGVATSCSPDDKGGDDTDATAATIDVDGQLGDGADSSAGDTNAEVDVEIPLEDADTTLPDAVVLDGTTTGWQDPCPTPPSWFDKADLVATPQSCLPPPGVACAKPGWSSPAAKEPLVFTDITAEIGFGDVGPADTCLLWQDFDGDGLADLFYVGAPDKPSAKRKLTVALNNGQGGFDLAVTPIEPEIFPLDCTAFDYDGDGHDDVVMPGMSGTALFRNKGGGGFENVSNLLPTSVRFKKGSGVLSWTAGALDYDHDGDLDLYIGLDGDLFLQCGAFECTPNSPPPYNKCVVFSDALGAPNRMLRNDGAAGFTDVTMGSGAADGGIALTVSVDDLDRDGWQDFFVGNDFGPHAWYRNNGDGTFAYLRDEVGLRPWGHVMGSAVADFDHDGLADLVIADFGANTLYRGLPGGGYSNDSEKAGVWPLTQDAVSWAQLATDFDNDGWPDLVTAQSLNAKKGLLADVVSCKSTETLPAGFHVLYHNLGDGKLDPAKLPFDAAATPNDMVVDSVVLASADLDGDGDLDLALVERPGRLRILRNDSAATGHWLRLDLHSVIGAPGGAGALVQLWHDGHVIERQVTPSPGYGARGDYLRHYGLGTPTTLDEVRVWWPSGRLSLFEQVGVDQTLQVFEAQATDMGCGGGGGGSDADASGDGGGVCVAVAQTWEDDCPEEPTTAQVELTSTAALGFAVPGNDCAKGSWPAPAAGAKLPELTDITAELGADKEGKLSPCLMWHDFSGDGRPDLLMVREALADTLPAKMRLLRPDGWGGVETSTIELPVGFAVSACAPIDYDGDGFADVVLGGPNGVRLLRNQGFSGFTNATAMLPTAATDWPVWHIGTLDYDRDGAQDLFLARVGGLNLTCGALTCKVEDAPPYATCAAGFGTAGTSNRFLRNLGDGSGFEDVTTASGTTDAAVSMSVSVGDVDRDGWPDLFVGNALSANVWYRNQANGTFALLDAALGTGDAGNTTTGTALGDIDGDGIDDLVVARLGRDSLYRGLADHGFEDTSEASGLWQQAKIGLSWGALPVDLDNDGHLDLITSHTVLPATAVALAAALTCATETLEAPWGHLILHNKGGGALTPTLLPVAANLSAVLSPAAVAAGDIDDDDDLDLVFIDSDGKLRILRNELSSANAALNVVLITLNGDTNGVGALVQVWSAGRVQERRGTLTTGRGAATARPLHFGLGTEVPDRVRVWWPSGRVSDIDDPPESGKMLVFEEDAHVHKPCVMQGGGGDGGGTDGGEVVDTVTWASYPQIDPNKLPMAKFTDVTADYGLPAGVQYAFCTAAADFDGNGTDDIVLIEKSFSTAILHTLLLDGEGGVQPKSSPFDTSMLFPNMGCSVADLDFDGKPDLLVGGTSGLAYYRNKGDGTFVDWSNEYLPYEMDFAAWSVAGGDFDGDGDIDLFVGAGDIAAQCNNFTCGYDGDDFACTYVSSPVPDDSMQDRMLIREAKLPYVDATAKWNLSPGGEATTIATVDFDKDGKLDVLVGNDFGPHRLLHNSGGAFSEFGVDIGFGTYAHAMGWGYSDFDGDGLLDFVLADAGPQILLLQNTTPPAGVPAFFEDHAVARNIAGPTARISGWNPLVGDFDQDGYDDIYFGVAAVAPSDQLGVIAACGMPANLPEQHDLIFLGKVGGFDAYRTVAETKPEPAFAAVAQSLIDLDNDGDLDIVQVRPSGAVRILRNDLTKVGGSVRLRLIGKGANTMAIGARVDIQIGPVKVHRQLSGNSGFGGAGVWSVHFALGMFPLADVVDVTWPDGAKSQLTKLGPGANVVLTQP